MEMEKDNMEQKKVEQFLCVKIGGRLLGVDATRIIEIVNPDADSPGTKLKDDGKAIKYQGKLLPTLRLADVLTGSETNYVTSQRILISKVGEKKAGLIVDSADEIVRIPKEKLSMNKPIVSDMNNEMLEGSVETGERTINILSLDKLYSLTGVSDNI